MSGLLRERREALNLSQADSLYFWRDRQVGVAVGSSCGHPGRARSRSHGGMAQQERGCLISIRS